jgi:peptide deformylase
MALLEILEYPNKILSTICKPIDHIDETMRQLAQNMAETMYDAPGVGLAAPQVGLSERLIVLDCANKEEGNDLIFAINPEIVEAAGECCEEEGCLSVPEYYNSVDRSSWVRVRYLDLNGVECERATDGLLAIAFQHEIDHLDGILFIDRLSRLKKSIFKKKYKKLQEQREEDLD